MRIFLDANILFSAAQAHSRMKAFVDLLLNLATKFPDGVKGLERLLKHCEITSQITTDLKVELALKDVPILGGAIAGHATHLLTGDEKDFGKFWGKTIQGVKVVSPRMLAEVLDLD